MGFTINPATGKLDVIRSFGVLDLRYLKLDCSNDPLTAALDLPELYNSIGDLKIMPDVQGNVTLFGDTSVGASAAVGKSLYLYKIYNTGSKYLRTYIDSTNQALFTTDCSTIWFNNSSGYMRLVGNTLYFDRTDGTIKGYAGNIVYGAGDISVEGGAGAYGNNDGGDLYLLGGSASGVGTDGSVIITGTVDWTGITGDIDVGSNAITTTGAVDASAYNITDKFITVATFTSAGIQAAITALGAEGGEVYLPEGEYDITSNISIAIDNVTIRGSGWGTILKNNTWGNWTGGADNTITVSGNYCNIKSLQIDGNSANTGETKYLLYITGTNCKVTDCFLQYSDYRGLLLGVACEARNNYVSNCDDAGIFLLGGGSQSIGNRTYGNGTNGIYVDGTNCSVIDNTVTSELGRGIYVDALDTRVIGNYITASADDGMYLSSSAENCVVSNNTFYGVANTKNDIKCVGDYNLISDNICNTYAGSSERGIYLDEADHCIVVNNMTYGHDTCGIQIDNDCDDTTVAGNSCQDTTPYVNNGTNSVFECSNSDITTTGTITSGYSVINQAADNLGVSISGFDDRSSNTLNAYIDASGDARLDSDSRHSILYINYSTGEGVDIGHTGTSTPLQVFGNITSDATIQGLTLTDGTATLTSGNFTTTGTLGAGPTTITAGATDLYPLKIDQGTTDLTSNSDSYGLWLDKDTFRTTYPAAGGNTYGFYSDLYLNDDMDAPSGIKESIGAYSYVTDVTDVTGASTITYPIQTRAFDFTTSRSGSDVSTGSSGAIIFGANGTASIATTINKATGRFYYDVTGGSFAGNSYGLNLISSDVAGNAYGGSFTARGAGGKAGTHSAVGGDFTAYSGSYQTIAGNFLAQQRYVSHNIGYLIGNKIDINNYNAMTGIVGSAFGIYIENMDAEDGVFTNLYGIKIASPEKDTGSIGTYNALWIDDATVAGTNRGIVIDSDTIGVHFGAAQDAKLAFTGTQFQIQSDLVTATDSLLLRGGTNGVAFNIGATEKMLLLADGLLMKDKIYFTQTDGNEYIDSLADGYLDLGATTQIRLKQDTLAEASLVVTGGFFPRQVDDNNMDATDGTEGEIVYNQDDNKFYGCTVTGTPATWGALN